MWSPRQVTRLPSVWDLLKYWSRHHHPVSLVTSLTIYVGFISNLKRYALYSAVGPLPSIGPLNSFTLHPPTDLFILAPSRLGSILLSGHAANTREHHSPTFPPPSLFRYSFIQLTELGLRVENENAQSGPLNRCRQRTTLSKNSNPVIVLHSKY